ncbi:hypothetical protein GB931_13460 [Modestobacter sp. I12A-02628]|uniref:Uncharacterized protein n=1 Tax=Goekera deserti TaxID=2497753 RepID=A0A7K3WA61_9ACTN|nr:hypothetical protein [Goekera deserti]MPQ98910.1 hypothetical protein [Goekera deserti]NDI49591.1 hypothetical protein [Goekera deserti]NEL53216.1 hypothetical protein [Goekera deserti]
MRSLVLGAALLLVAGCGETVDGSADPAAGATAETSARPSRTPAPGAGGGAQPPCTGAACDEPTSSGTPATEEPVSDEPAGDDAPGVSPVDVACAPFTSAVDSFDAVAGSAFPGGLVTEFGSPEAIAWLDATVDEVVERCGYQVMVDIAGEYPEEVSPVLLNSAVVALDEVSDLPPDLLCQDVEARGMGAKDAVDYWFLWQLPAAMDADADGVPCETVWPDAAEWLPQY